MTLNERLVATNLLGPWEAAVEAGDRAELIRILRSVAVSSPDCVADAALTPSIRHRL
jgi:hypothetical protein